MRRSVRRLLCVFAAPAAVAALVVVPQSASAHPRATEVGAFDWQACADAPGFECSVFPVPLDYDSPGSGTIDLAVIRHVATDPVHRLGSLFFNPGGPGDSGVSALPELYDLFPAQVRADFDLVSFDPRGVGGSAGVFCFPSPDQESALVNQAPVGFPVGRDEQQTWIEVYRQFGQACGDNAGPVLGHMSTANVARDMDRLRQAVGDPKLNYLGISYGTYLGATYANLFPSRVRAMVLDSDIDAGAWADELTGTALGTFLRIGSDQGSGQTLAEFVQECGNVDASRCAFSAGSPDATRAKLDALLARFRAGPIVVEGTPIPYAAVVAAIVSGLYVVSPDPARGRIGWTGLAGILQVLWTASSGGTVPSRAGGPAVRLLTRRGPTLLGEPSYLAGVYGVLCSDSPNPRLPWLYPAQEAYADARSGPVGSLWAWQSEPCATWPVAADPDRYLGPFDHVTAAPILLVGITHDPATPYQAAVNLSQELARARLLTVDGSGHTSLLNPSTCALADESAYFIDGALPPVGAVCHQDHPAF